MKKNLVKFAAVLSGLALLGTSLAGCNKKPGASETPAPVTSENPGTMETPDTWNPEIEQNLLAFADGGAKIKVTQDGIFALANGGEYSLEDLRENVNRAYDEMFEPGTKKVIEIDYAIIDCGKDGRPELAICVVGDTDSRDSEIRDYYIVTENNGELTVAANFESFYRAWGDLNKYGVFHMSGSGGASLMVETWERVNANGEYEFIYSCESELAMGEPVIYGYELPTGTELPQGYPYTAAEYADNNREKYSFAPMGTDMRDESPEYDEYLKKLVYVFHDANGNVIYPKDEYRKIYDDLGIVVTDDDNIKQLINQRIAELGISEEEMYTLDSTPDSVPTWNIAWDGLEAQPLEP